MSDAAPCFSFAGKCLGASSHLSKSLNAPAPLPSLRGQLAISKPHRQQPPPPPPQINNQLRSRLQLPPKVTGSGASIPLPPDTGSNLGLNLQVIFKRPCHRMEDRRIRSS
ncbi:hypothetical protein FKM82_031154 [Ascaphus truei]